MFVIGYNWYIVSHINFKVYMPVEQKYYLFDVTCSSYHLMR